MSGAENPYRSSLYRALVAPLRPAEGGGADPIDGLSPEGAEEIIARVSAARGGLPRSAGKLPRFEAIALRELEMAGRMDVLAWRRVLAAKALRAGQSLPAHQLHDLAGQTIAVAGDFEKLWMERNKPSRLRDNLALFDRAAAEARKLAAAGQAGPDSRRESFFPLRFRKGGVHYSTRSDKHENADPHSEPLGRRVCRASAEVSGSRQVHQRDKPDPLTWM